MGAAGLIRFLGGAEVAIITTSAAAALADGARVRLVLRELSVVGSIEEITMYQTVEGNENFHATKGCVDG